MPDEYDFDVAVSFAGEDRTLVAEIVGKLKDHQVSVFYDQDFVSDMWGENLADYLHEIYRRRARFALVFISRHYVTRMWTRHERQSAQDRALNQPTPYLLPLRLDDTELPGLASTVGYLDAREKTVDEIVAVLLDKLGTFRQETTPRFNGKVPRTRDELTILLAERPVGWEYLFYASVLRHEVAKREDKYRDHLLGYAALNGRYIDDSDALDTIRKNMSRFSRLTASFTRVLSPEAQTAAFGPPGQPGDVDRIVHLGRRLVSVYEEILDVAADLRATAVTSPAFRQLLDIEARFWDLPLQRIRDFVQQLVAEADTIAERLRRDEPVNLQFVVTVEIAEDLLNEHDLALAAYGRERGL